jgi:hypothetical protein
MPCERSIKEVGLRWMPYSCIFTVFRPTAEQLLQMPFFKNAKKPSYLVGAVLSMYQQVCPGSY